MDNTEEFVLKVWEIMSGYMPSKSRNEAAIELLRAFKVELEDIDLDELENFDSHMDNAVKHHRDLDEVSYSDEEDEDY